MFKKIAFIASALVVAATAFAQTAPATQTKPSVDARQANQEQRIQQGVDSGRLTTAEAARLQKGETRIDAAQSRVAADGTVTKQEKKHLVKLTQRESQAIYKQKHDRQNDRDHDGQRDHRQGGHNKK